MRGARFWAPRTGGYDAMKQRRSVPYLPLPLNSDLMRSRFSWEMDSSGIPFGQTAEHSPMLVQFPKPSSSCWATIDFTRR